MGRSNWVNWAPTVSGPLAEYAAGYERWLVDRGFTPEAKGVAARVWQLGQLSRWLEAEELAPGQLTAEQVARFVAPRRAAGRHHWVSPLSLRLPLAFLREAGAVPDRAPSVCEGPLARLVADYRRYLAQERGVTEKTIKRYERVARLFVGERAQGGGLDLERLTAADVTEFLARECPKRSVPGARELAQSLRPLLRYLHVAGLIQAPLRWAVPRVADLSDRSLPRGLDPVVVRKLLSSCDRRCTVGRRDYAVLLLMVRLGLRAGEVAALRLDDVDWRRGEIVVRGKGSRLDRLPLPVDVGEALVSHLRRRPPFGSRALFLKVRAPAGPLTTGVIECVVRDACRSSGLPVVGPHRLRHTAATEMLNASASLAEIGQVLPSSRHEDDRTLCQGRSPQAQGAGAAVAGSCGVIDLRTPLRSYLAVRRQLGFELKEAGRGLEDFVGFLERARADRVTTELAVAWAKLPVDAQPDHWRRRLGWVRGFARYLATIDPESDVPSKDLLPARGDRVAPHIYSEAEIVVLMAAAWTVRPPSTAASIETLIGLMASTGLRLGEALGLDRQHVDLDDGVLQVRAAKQSKQREVPLHPTTTVALRDYARVRDRYRLSPRRRHSSPTAWGSGCRNTPSTPRSGS